MNSTEQDLDSPEEAVGSLDGPEPLAVQRIIEQEEGRTVSLTATLGYLNGSEFDKKSIAYGANPLPLFDSESTQVGYASLFTEGNELKADLFFTYGCPDRLTIETKAFPIYAYPVAMTNPDAVYILAVKLDSGKPADGRIQAL